MRGDAAAQTRPSAPLPELRPRRWPRIVLLSTLLLIVALIGYGATLAPVHVAHLQERTSDSAEALDLGGDATVVAPQGWGVRPLVRELISWQPLPPLLDWSVVFGARTGVVLTSPDGVLTVSLLETAASTPGAVRAELGAARGSEEQADLGDDHRRNELLASGLQLTHFDGDTVVFATLVAGEDAATGHSVGVLARTNGTDIDAYRPALSELLERVALAD